MVVEMSRHPNIQGIKSSYDYSWTHQLRTMTKPDFRIIPAQPNLVVPLFRVGIEENLDGIFAVVPVLMRHLIVACEKQDWQKADEYQADLSALLRLVTISYPVFPACEVIMNAQGVQGNFC